MDMRTPEVVWDETLPPVVMPACPIDRKLLGQKALVTGASSGIGKGIAIGRNAAIIEFGRVKLTGRLAWWLWGFAHIYILIGVRAPMIVAAQWFWAYLTFGRGARLITGLQPLFEDLKMPKVAARVPADSRG